MINSFTNKLKTFIFNSKTDEHVVIPDRKRKRNESPEDGDIVVVSVKKPKLHNAKHSGLLSSAAVQSMSDWVQKRTPNLFNWTSNKSASGSHHGNGLNGKTERRNEQTSTHHRFSKVDVPEAYRQGSWPVDDRSCNGRQALSRPSIHLRQTKSTTVQTERDPGMAISRCSQPRMEDLFRTRNQHNFTAMDSVRLDDKNRYRELLQKFTTVPLEESETGHRNDSFKRPVRVPQLPRFYFKSNTSILGSTISESQEKVQACAKPKIKVHPSQSTPRQHTNGIPPGVDSVMQLTDISAISPAQADVRQTHTIDLTEDKEPDKADIKGFRMRKVKSPTLDYRCSKFISENWIKDMNSTYNSTARERQRQLKEAEIKAKIYDERRKQDEMDLDRRIRQQMYIHKRTPIVIEDPPIEDVEEEEEEEPLPELTGEMSNMITNALSRGNPSQVLVDKFRLQITKNDVATLSALNWLNDEVINFYMNLLMERGENENKPKVYAFNTFFYPKVMSGGQAAVKRWTRRIDVLAVDYILIPVHLGMHWCLAVICFKKKDIQYYDSMGGNNTQCLSALKQYLCDESLDKKKKGFDLTDWKTTLIKDIPQQMNGSDCGMFACKYAEYITREAPITFTQDHMPYFRRRMVYEIVTAKLLQ